VPHFQTESVNNFPGFGSQRGTFLTFAIFLLLPVREEQDGTDGRTDGRTLANIRVYKLMDNEI
jgi:hypothetical protein